MARHFRWCLVQLLTGALLLSSGSTAAQTPTAALQVTVTSPGTHEPISDAQITLQAGDTQATLDLPNNENDLLAYLQALAQRSSSGPPATIVMGNGRTLRVAPESINGATDAQGIATFTGLKPGTYTVRARADGFFADPKEPATLPNPVAIGVVNVESGGAAVSLSLNRGASVSGRIHSANRPLANGRIELGMLNVLSNGRKEFSYTGFSALIEANGAYLLPSAPPGEYVLRVRLLPTAVLGYYPGTADLEEAVSVSIPPGGEVAGIDVDLP